MCQFQLHNIFHIDITQNIPDGSKTSFPFDHVYDNILQTDKLTFISYVFNVIMNLIVTSLFKLTNCFFLFPQSRSDSLYFNYCVFSISFLWMYLWLYTHHLIQVYYRRQYLFHLKMYLKLRLSYIFCLFLYIDSILSDQSEI